MKTDVVLCIPFSHVVLTVLLLFVFIISVYDVMHNKSNNNKIKTFSKGPKCTDVILEQSLTAAGNFENKHLKLKIFFL